ncbi:MAG TPA: M28 family peptidase [Blastocatellia bacterium]|nr:M28 family peptidase [Blastocatellia bacterium]HMV83744.1 M28 family peptidase [Blastocatellia bacterium]HMY71983.1 M28 family peptidase [Blastocatellia bacterium]HNG31203.1 M28 family peptidase [Blastocatellia bacterium]
MDCDTLTPISSKQLLFDLTTMQFVSPPTFNAFSFFLTLALFFSLAPETGGAAQSRSSLEAVTRQLTDPAFDGRAFKTEGGRKAADFIAAQFREAGLKPVGSDFLQTLGGGGQNVAGLLTGRQDEFVLVGAHYDAFGGRFAGAIDNAAGVAVMIELARQLAKSPLQRGVLFVAFDGSEQQEAGAKFYAGHPLLPFAKTIAAVHLSGFGGGWSEQLHDTLYVVGAEFSPRLAAAIAKHKRGDAHLALIGEDTTQFLGGEHFKQPFKQVPGIQVPSIAVTNGVHYAYHSKADIINRVNFAALEKHVAALRQVIAEIVGTPGKIERQTTPTYDADETTEWQRTLTALRENVIKVAANAAGQSHIDDALLELKRFKGVALQDVKAREAVILRAASICFYIANPNGVEFNSLLDAARTADQRGQRAQSITAYKKLLKFLEEDYRRDDQTVSEIRAKAGR